MGLILLALVTAFAVGGAIGTAVSRATRGAPRSTSPVAPAEQARSDWRRTTYDPPEGIDA